MSRDYVIINGKNSLTISGLAIKTLPPISKPLMRTMREEIDGRDGDINTELGYQAYDKPLEVGLFGNYDINEIIAFFNSKGTIVFSDEPDKFYNFQILDKIDFTKLVKFRTAMVNIHCQPFKYPVEETPIEVEYEYVTGEGTSISLDTNEGEFVELQLNGNAEEGTGVVNVVTGNNELFFDDGTPWIIGVERPADTSTTTWTRTKDGVNLVAEATKNGGKVKNYFDFIMPWAGMRRCNQNPTTKEITAWYGDANFKTDGTNGNVMTYVPEFYYRTGQYSKDGVLTDFIEISSAMFEGATKSEEFYVSSYQTGLVDSKPVSIAGVGPEVNRSIVSFRTLYNNNGYTQLDYHYFLLQMLYLVEYANNNSQSALGNGVSSVRYNAGTTSKLAETSTNRVVIPTDTNFQVGNTLCIGTAQGSYNIAKYRTITAINSYSSGGVTGTELVFDGEPVNIAVGNWAGCCGQLSGQNDLLGNKSGSILNDSKHAVSYRGIENIFGNVFQWVDGINIKDRLAYICTKPSSYQSDKFDGDYHALGYTNATTDGWIKTLGYDSNYPIFRLPTSVGGVNSTYYTDYYYQNTGNRVARVGGNFSFGTYDGLFFWHLNAASSTTSVYFGSRFLYLP